MTKLGPKFIKLAIIATILSIMVIALIVVSIHIFTDEEKSLTLCEISNSTDLVFIQIGSVLMIQWDLNESCIRNYKVSLETPGSSSDVLTDKNYLVYQDLDYCKHLTVTIQKESVIFSKIFVPEIGKINNLEITDGFVKWENKHFNGCNFKIKFDDLNEFEESDFFELPILDTCKNQSVTITPFTSTKIGKSTTKQLPLNITGISDLQITKDQIEWNNTEVKSCDIEIYMNGDLFETITSGENLYTFTTSLMFCTEYEIEIIAVEKNLGRRGNPVSEKFEDGPIIESFEINNLVATWENSHPNCIYSIELNGTEVICDVLPDSSTCTITSTVPELCTTYNFELKSQRIDGETKYPSAEYKYITNFDTIDDFDVDGMQAKWKYFGPSCEYEILVNDGNLISVSNDDTDYEYYTKEISMENLDVCKTENEAVLIARFNEEIDRELGRSSAKMITINSDLVKIEELTLDLNETNQKLVAEWRNLGDSCTYNVKYEGKKSVEFNTEKNRVILDDELGFISEYCTTHTVSVNILNSDVESTNFTKDLTEGFEAISGSIYGILMNKIMKIQWDLNEEFKPCADIYYKVAGYIDDPKPDMIDTNVTSYIFEEYTIDGNTDFFVEIQAAQRSNDENEEVKGSINRCSFHIDGGGTVSEADCVYLVK